MYKPHACLLHSLVASQCVALMVVVDQPHIRVKPISHTPSTLTPTRATTTSPGIAAMLCLILLYTARLRSMLPRPLSLLMLLLLMTLKLLPCLLSSFMRLLLMRLLLPMLLPCLRLPLLLLLLPCPQIHCHCPHHDLRSCN